MLIPLRDACEERLFGGKATQLGEALRAGLPVPPGFAIAHEVVAAAVAFHRADTTELAAALAQLGELVAVRSSAVGEDSATASFAGQHATLLGIRGVDGVLTAIEEVVASAHTYAALAYRARLGLDPHPKMGIVVQKLVRSDVAGVLFTRHPTTHADERVIEASWGLGEAVVQGLVTPDRYRLLRDGTLLEQVAGEKDLAIYWADGGGVEERPIEGPRVEALCLSLPSLRALEGLATRCEAVFGGTQDLEFAFEDGELFLLQRRAITRR